MHDMCAAHMIARIHAVAGAHVGKWLRITAIIPHIGRPMLTTHAMSFTTTKHRPHQRPKIMVAGSSVEGCSPSCHNIVCNGCFGLVGHGVQGTWSRNVHDRGRFIEGHLGWPQLPLYCFRIAAVIQLPSVVTKIPRDGPRRGRRRNRIVRNTRDRGRSWYRGLRSLNHSRYAAHRPLVM